MEAIATIQSVQVLPTNLYIPKTIAVPKVFLFPRIGLLTSTLASLRRDPHREWESSAIISILIVLYTNQWDYEGSLGARVRNPGGE